MTQSLVVHRGGWEASKADLAAIAVPDPTESYHPVPYPRFVEEVELHIPRFGLRIESEAFALAREGAQMFGVLTCTNGHGRDEYALAIGLRNSYDRSLSVGLVAGVRVFVCDNLAFSGESNVNRKHTVHVFRDLPELVYGLLSRVGAMQGAIERDVDLMKQRELPDRLAHHLMVVAVKDHALPASRIPQVLERWLWPRHEEFKPRTAWSLFNAFTDVQKDASPRLQMDGTLRLTQLFRRELELGQEAHDGRHGGA